MLAKWNILLGLLATSSLAQDIVLPSAPGPYNVTIRTSQLDDFSRPENYSSTPQHRRIMVSVFSPVRQDVSACKSPYMPPDVAAVVAAAHPDWNIDFTRFFLKACSADVTYGKKKPDKTNYGSGDFPLIIFGPGLGFSRFYYSLISQFLSSYGYIVVNVDHPYDGLVVQFPDNSTAFYNGVILSSLEEAERDLFTRSADVSFVVDQIASNKTLNKLIFPGNVSPSSVKKVGVWGHSFGGATAATVLYQDKRFKGGINLDGTMIGPAPQEGFDRPFILWKSEHDNDPTWAQIWPHLPGFKRHLEMTGSQHTGLSDLRYLADLVGVNPPEFGTINGLLEIKTLAKYVRDFFGFVLQDKGRGLVGKADPDFPHVKFLPAP